MGWVTFRLLGIKMVNSHKVAFFFKWIIHRKFEVTSMMIFIIVILIIFLFDFTRIRKQNDTMIEQNEKIISLLEENKKQEQS